MKLWVLHYLTEYVFLSFQAANDNLFVCSMPLIKEKTSHASIADFPHVA